jgi:zona occludens toxin
MGSNTFLSPHNNKPASPQSSSTASPNAPASPVGTTGDNPATDQSAAEAHELTRPAQIVSSSAGDCYAKNSYGELLDISADKCNLYAEHPNLLSGSRIAPSVQSRPSDQNLASSQVAYTNPVPTQQSQL